jgi:hypothetical protein
MFLAQIVKELGPSNLTTGFILAILYVVGAIGHSADKIAKRKPMASGQRPGERTDGAKRIGSPVKPWKPAIS